MPIGNLSLSLRYFNFPEKTHFKIFNNKYNITGLEHIVNLIELGSDTGHGHTPGDCSCGVEPEEGQGVRC